MEGVFAFFRQLGGGSRPSRPHAILVFAIVGGFLVFLVASSMIVGTWERRKSRRALGNRYQGLVARFGLSNAEQDLLKAMTRYLADPHKKYLLLINRHTLASCVQMMRRHEELPAATYDSLREKLGLETDKVPVAKRTTRDLRLGSTVRIEVGDAEPRITAVVSATGGEELRLFAQDKKFEVRTGSRVTLFNHDYRGIGYYHTRVIAVAGGEITLEHAPNRMLLAGAGSALRAVNLKVFVSRDADNAPEFASVIVDLMANGARMKNPNRRYRAGDDLRIYFRQRADRWNHINATDSAFYPRSAGAGTSNRANGRVGFALGVKTVRGDAVWGG